MCFWSSSSSSLEDLRRCLLVGQGAEADVGGGRGGGTRAAAAAGGAAGGTAWGGAWGGKEEGTTRAKFEDGRGGGGEGGGSRTTRQEDDEEEEEGRAGPSGAWRAGIGTSGEDEKRYRSSEGGSGWSTRWPSGTPRLQRNKTQGEKDGEKLNERKQEETEASLTGSKGDDKEKTWTKGWLNSPASKANHIPVFQLDFGASDRINDHTIQTQTL